MYELRQYQKEAVNAAYINIRDKKKPGIIVLPTGSGKSLVIANIIKFSKGKTLVLQPSKEILEQNYGKFISYDTGLDVGIYSASCGQKDIRDVTFAMIGSIIRKKELFSDFQNIIVDECHLVAAGWGMYADLLDYLKGCSIVGLTATPYRLASNSFGSVLRLLTRSRPKIFNELINIYFSG